MATYTEKYNLKKPDETDFIDIADINENMDKIATALDDVEQTAIPISEKAVANGVATLDENGKVPAEQLSVVGILPRLDVSVLSASREIVVTNGTIEFRKGGNENISFNLPCFGEWTISDGEVIRTINVDTVKVYSVSFLSLEKTSWAEIAEISASGMANKMWSVGDTKNIKISDENYTFVILDFNFDDKSDGTGKAGITFGLKNLMSTVRKMSSAIPGYEGFVATELYTWLQEDLFYSLPLDLQTVIKPVDKICHKPTSSSAVSSRSMKIFLFSEREIFNSASSGLNSVKEEGANRYTYFSANSRRIKYLNNGNSQAYEWWTRSPIELGTDAYCTVKSDGSPDWETYSSSVGICFGFCV
ncbi:MAG: hypothetical protein K2G22_07340 [Eubacterium sp.]|nr:hypothetical protein [Eubacterium sp.]